MGRNGRLLSVIRELPDLPVVVYRVRFTVRALFVGVVTIEM
jgi:hypothetical protein